MINFKCLDIQSFKSIFKATLDFDLMQGKFYQLEGKNETVDFASSNGSGKTTCLNALAFAIYGTTLDIYMKAEEYQNKNTSVPLTLSLVFGVQQQGSSDEQLYTVIRTLKSLKLYKGEEDISELTKTETEKKLLKIIGITKDEFFSFTYLTQYSGGNFLNKTASEKLAVIREFVFGDELLDIKTRIDKLLKQIGDQNKQTLGEVDRLKGRIESLVDVLDKESLESTGQQMTEEKYKKNKEEIEFIADKIAAADKDASIRQQLNRNLEALRKDMMKLKGQAEKLSDSVCPTCGQLMQDDLAVKLREDIRTEARNKKLEAKKIKTQLRKMKEDLDDVDIYLFKERKAQLESYNIDYLSSLKLRDKQNYAKANIESLQEELKQLTIKLDKLEVELKQLKDLKSYFNTKFIQEVQQTFLSEIENYLNLYCYDLFNSAFELKFTGNSLELLIGGKPYSYFSGGERQKIDFLFVFAIKFILSSFTDKCTNLLLADEALSAQDACSFDNCVDLIKRLAESSGLTVILVSHRETSNITQNKILLTRYEDKTKLEILTI